jgi:hypothetical protein
MYSSHSHPRAVLSLLALAMLSACGKTDTTPAADAPGAAPASSAAATPAAEPPVVTIIASDYKYDAPDTIAAGMVTLKLVNKGPELHHVQLFRLTGGKTLADLAAGMKTMKETDPLPPWVEVVAGPNSPVPGGEQTLTEELTAGTYVMLCLIPSPDHMPHVMKGMMRGLTVVPATGAVAAAPTADITVRMTDYAWDLPSTVAAGKHMIRVENDAPQQHEMFIARLDKGRTPSELAEWALSPKGPPPGMPMGGMSGMAKGTVAYVPVDLTPGEYALLCFIPDAKDGKPHFRHGMMKSFTVN